MTDLENWRKCIIMCCIFLICQQTSQPVSFWGLQGFFKWHWKSSGIQDAYLDVFLMDVELTVVAMCSFTAFILLVCYCLAEKCIKYFGTTAQFAVVTSRINFKPSVACVRTWSKSFTWLHSITDWWMLIDYTMLLYE